MKYETHFASNRPDGRHVCTMAAQMAMMRDMKPLLALPESLTEASFRAWQEKVREKLTDLLCMPEFTEQPAPTLISRHQRDGYVCEKWEFYPDDYTAVPFLALIPDGASKEHPVPGVMCFLGSNHSKEFICGEEEIDHPNCKGQVRFPDRNRMALYMVKNGMAAFAFDNPAIGECSLMTDPALGQTQGDTRVQLCHGLLDLGLNYVGLSVFQKLCFMKHLKTLEYVDQDRIAVSSHSLGTETAIALGILRDEIKAIVFNDNLRDALRHYVAITEQTDGRMVQNIGNWHIIPGKSRYFGLPEMCAAFAPRHLALTEGGPDETIGIVKRAYGVFGAEENVLVSHYPAYTDPAARTWHDRIPDRGLSPEEYDRMCFCDAPDHSFRQDPAIRLLKTCFGMT